MCRKGKINSSLDAFKKKCNEEVTTISIRLAYLLTAMDR
jgi:hypothetical protein